MIFAVK